MEELKNNLAFSVSEFLAVINQTLDYAYPTVEIEGEVSSFKVNQNKFVFFDLKDDDGSISCFIMLWQMRLPIVDGMKVIVVASPKITKFGKFSLTVKSIRPSGEGELKKSFDLLKAKLEKEGLFSEERKRLLPALPKHIGVISSTGAAGYADFIKIIGDRFGGLKIDVCNVQVQGNGAPDQIIRAINYLNEQSDLPEAIVIIRGGGSSDDLSTFNDELLVRAIASSRIPILTGVGHEVDQSLSDLAADVSASTPSNAAQILVPDKREIISQLNIRLSHVSVTLTTFINQLYDNTLINFRNITQDINNQFDKQMKTIEKMKLILNELNPKTVLKRGYAIINGILDPGKTIKIETIDKLITAEVKNVKRK